MDDNAKKKLAAVKKLVQEKQYQMAIDQLQVMVYKYAKLYQVHLMAGLCYQKLQKLNEAEKAYLEVIDLKPDESNAIKELCDIYGKKGDLVKSTRYMQLNAQLYKKSDYKKYRDTVCKLVQLYEKDENLQKIDPIFHEYVEREEQIGEDFVKIAAAYYRVGVKNQCFNLQKFQKMGMHGEKMRSIIPAAREQLNLLLIEIVGYLLAVSKQYQLSRKDIANSLVQMKLFFPEAPCMLMLLLFDEYCVGQLNYSSLIMQEVYKLMLSYFDKQDNGYLNLEYTEPQIFTVCMILSHEYLAFFKEFFTLEEILVPYYQRLVSKFEELQLACKIREGYRKKISGFILKQCRELYSESKYGNVEGKLQELKGRIISLQDSYLQEVIAKIAINCFTSYQKISDIKNLLKLRIRNLPATDSAPHLYKYYYEYIFKIATLFKSLDEEIPLAQIHEYIALHDPKDLKYRVDRIWFQFSMSLKGEQTEQQKELAAKSLLGISELYQQLEIGIKSGAVRKMVLLKVFMGDYEIEGLISQLLSLERSFQNLQCAGFFFYFRKDYKEAVVVLKQAFRLNQMHYHTNRLLFLTLLKTDGEREAIDFLQRIHQGFTSVFWINYLIGISKINGKKFLQAERFMSTALQNFEAASSGKFKFSYERVRDVSAFSLLYMVQQNQYAIFYDELIFPEEFIYGEFRVASSLYFHREAERNRINLYVKEGELLKILGRTTTSLNYIQQAYVCSSQLVVGQESEVKLIIEICLMKKEYSTLLFYMRQLKESEVVLSECYLLVVWLGERRKEEDGRWTALIDKIDNQIKALAFEISVERLSVMMKFESYEFIDDYLIAFKKTIENPSKPTLNFYKNKYQFYILEYMHNRKHGQQFTQAIADFLAYFQLDLHQRLAVAFQNQLFSLNDEDRRSVRECLEDYFVICYISEASSVKEGEMLHMVQLFPRSSIFYILFGMVAEDVKLKTAAFLRCIQLDKESAISIDILASLYLKQKNYLAAVKLFLKSLELDVLNTKCYLGLTICLFCLVTRCIDNKQPEQISIIQKCLVRINSYMEYMQVNDPSQNYHILNFLKMLLTQERKNNFQIKIVLQSAQRACFKYRNTLLNQLLEEATKEWRQLNIWSNDDQLTIIQNYIYNHVDQKERDIPALTFKIGLKIQNATQELEISRGAIGKEILIKRLQKELNEVLIGLNLSLKAPSFNQSMFNQYHTLVIKLQQLMQKTGLILEQLTLLKYKIKDCFYDCLFKAEYSAENKRLIDAIFPEVYCFEYLAKHHEKIPNLEKEIKKNLLLHPASEEMRKIYTGFLVGRKGVYVRKAKLSYQLQVLNSINDEFMTNQSNCYKKLALLYHDPAAFFLYISHAWNNSALKDEGNVKKLLRNVVYLQKKREVQSDKALLEKTRRLKLEMLGYCRCHFGSEPFAVQLPLEERQKLNKIVVVNEIIKLSCQSGEVNKLKIKFKQLASLYKGDVDQFDWWILMTLFSFVNRKFRTDKRYEACLDHLAKQAKSPDCEGFVLLLCFASLLYREASTEQQLTDQIVGMMGINQRIHGKVNPNTQAILQCQEHLLTNACQEMEAELARVVQENKVVSYSDKILLNFFETILQFKAADNNPNGEGVIESFVYTADCMIGIAREPLIKGFFLSLKGIIGLKTSEEGMNRSTKQSMLLSPIAAKCLLEHR